MHSVRTWVRGASIAAGVLAIAAAPVAANAVPAPAGTVAIGTTGFIPGPTDTLMSPLTVTPGSPAFGVGTGDLSGLNGVAISGFSFDITSLATLEASTSFNGGGVSFGSVTSGAYTAPRTDHVLSAELIGTLTTPTSSGPAALLINFGQVGGPGTAISVGATLTTTIPPIPEPLSIAVLGTGLLGLGLAVRRRTH